MQQNSTKIVIGIVVAFSLLIVSTYKLDSNFFGYLSELVSGSYKEQVAKIKGIESSTSNEETNSIAPLISIKKCSFKSTTSPTHENAIFHEIAWMGNNKDTKNEWITLKKISADEIDISHWQIINQNEKLHVIIPKGKILNENKKSFVISRQTKIDGIIPDFVFIGIIKNSNEILKLFDSSCNLIDEVSANPNWPAGDNGSASLTTGKTKKPMIRLPNLSWQTKGASANSPQTDSATITANKTKILETKPPAITPLPVDEPTCININTAPKTELVKIIHVGEKTADKIIAYRSSSTFSSVDELTNIKGIGSSTLDNIKKQGVACLQ